MLKLRLQYHIPAGVIMRVRTPDERASDILSGECCFYMSTLADGVRLPPTQFVMNAWYVIMCAGVLWKVVGNDDITPEEFLSFYKLQTTSSNHCSWFRLASRETHRKVAVDTARHLLWKYKFFYVSRDWEVVEDNDLERGSRTPLQWQWLDSKHFSKALTISLSQLARVERALAHPNRTHAELLTEGNLCLVVR